MSIEYRSPSTASELDDSFACSTRAFGGDESDLRFFTSIVKNDPWFRLENTRACFVDGRVASVVQIFDRPMRIGNRVVRAGGLGSVGTDPPHRNRGYALGVLEASADYMSQAGYDISLLYTGRHSHYGKLGWVMQPTFSARIAVPEAFGGASGQWEIRPGDLEADLPALMAIHDRYNADRTGTVDRSESYWRSRRSWSRDPCFIWMADRKRSSRAYLLADRWQILEFGCLPGEDEALADLMRRFVHQAASEGRREVQVPRCPTEILPVFESLGCKAQRREQTSAMFRIIDLASLLEKLVPLLQSRVASSDSARREVTVGFVCEAGRCTLALPCGRVSAAGPSSAPDLQLPLSQEQFLRMTIGNLNARNIASANRLELTPPEVDLVDTLFPRDEWFTWRTDGF